MLRPYVELAHSPQPYEVRELPEHMALVALYEGAEQLECHEDGAENATNAERWRALCYTLTVPNTPNLSQRVEAALPAWLAKAKALAVADAAHAVRRKRDQLLRDCDYTTGTDYPATDAERDAWREYRQQLRDVPEQPGFPWDIIWPSAPAREKAADTILATIDELIGG